MTRWVFLVLLIATLLVGCKPAPTKVEPLPTKTKAAPAQRIVVTAHRVVGFSDIYVLFDTKTGREYVLVERSSGAVAITEGQKWFSCDGEAPK